MERPNYHDLSKMGCTCMIFSNNFPELFLAFYDILDNFMKMLNDKLAEERKIEERNN